jgi:Kunitz/Bovine pancreatic trypsin inhibitor domain
MMKTGAAGRFSTRFNLGFLMRQARGRVAVVAAVAGLVWLGACESRPLNPQPDADTTGCASVGCAAPPLCSAGCQATCGCCSCAPGERNGDLVCTSAGCYAPAQLDDAGADSGADAGAIVCSLPFEVGPCDAAIPVYAYVNGACVARTYGGCQGNGNRFNTIEECMVTCEGRPVPNGCPAGRVAKEICLGCGPAGGCSKSQTVCALPCDADAGAAACSMALPICSEGVCQYAFCH